MMSPTQARKAAEEAAATKIQRAWSRAKGKSPTPSRTTPTSSKDLYATVSVTRGTGGKVTKVPGAKVTPEKVKAKAPGSVKVTGKEAKKKFSERTKGRNTSSKTSNKKNRNSSSTSTSKRNNRNNSTSKAKYGTARATGTGTGKAGEAFYQPLPSTGRPPQPLNLYSPLPGSVQEVFEEVFQDLRL